MNETKPWYTSVGVWGAVVSLIGATLSLLKVQVDPLFLEDLRQWLISAATLAGAGAALYGRVRARRRISAPDASHRPLLLLALVALLGTGGCSAMQSPVAAYVAADRATFEAIAPEYLEYVEDDPSLIDEQRQRRERTVAAWRLRVEEAEGEE